MVRVLRGGFACAFLFMSAAAAADDDLQVGRIETPAAVSRGNGTVITPTMRSALLPGDVLRTGPGGHVSVKLAGGGSFMLAANTAVRIESTSPPDPPGRTVLLKLQLDDGAVHVDARKLEQAAPADVRIALPQLKARLYGTDGWAEVSHAGEELCIASGAAEIDTPSGHQRLDEAGECLRWTAQHGVTRVPAHEVGTLAPRYAQTTFDDDYATRYAAMQARRDGSAKPSLAELNPAPRPVVAEAGSETISLEAQSAAAPAVAAAPPVAAAVAAAAPVAPASAAPPVPATAPALPAPPAPAPRAISGPSEWRLVLASSTSKPQVEARAKKLRARGWNLDIVDMQVGSIKLFRVLANHYPTRDAASAAQAKTHKFPDLKDAWIIEVPRAR